MSHHWAWRQCKDELKILTMSRSKVAQVLRAVGAASCRCPAHGSSVDVLHPKASVGHLYRRASQRTPEADYAFEMASSTVRYGPGVTREVGMDVQNLGITKLCVITDQNLSSLPPVQSVLDSLHANDVTFSVFDMVSIEPTNISIEKAIAFARQHNFDGFVAVGGGSVMDTAKAANLFLCYPDKELMDFVNAPIGKGEVPTKALKPLVCVPTTAGTGSETTGVVVFDHKDPNIQAKIGIGCRAIRPTLGLIDPLHMKYMPQNVAAYSGFDVLCHALESYTALPYTDRSPRPLNPRLRPAYQGSNPVADIWSKHSLGLIRQYFRRAVKDPEDTEARAAMHLASTCAGIGFGNAGVHLCHGMSYPISGKVREFTAEGYSQSKPLIPHGLSVVITAPAVFRFTAPLCPERHIEAAEILGGDVRNAKPEDAGEVLAEVLLSYMQDLGVVDGLGEMGYASADIPTLVQGTLSQERVTKLSPRSFTEDQLAQLFENSLRVY